MSRIVHRVVLALMACSFVLAACLQAVAAETPEQRDARMKWWREARFGMFIHWGVYSVPAGQWEGKPIPSLGEWIQNTAKIPCAEYQALTKQFNPVNFNADKWARIAKDAGMKYIVITSKHHDGFAMFRSKASAFNIYDATPFKRDPIKELAAACKKHGLKFGFYYSQSQDWNHPGGACIGGKWDKFQDGDYDEFIRNVDIPQVKELLTNYGKIAVLWWDTPVDMSEERQQTLFELTKLQPGIITNDRLGGRGDFRTPEQTIPVNDTQGDWETCMTINDTWGFKSDDNNWKSSAQLIRNLAEIASKGGNLLLNVGPTSLGEIPEPSVDRLEEMGRWMKVNGRAIYGATRSPFRHVDFTGVVTVNGSTMFIHAFEFPAEGVTLKGFANKVKSVRFVDGGAKADYTATVGDDGNTVLAIKPPAKIDPADTVIEVRLDAAPKVGYHPIRQKTDGTISLRAADAQFTRALQYDRKNDSTDRWLGTPDSAFWDVDVTQPGDYKVDITYAWYKTDIDSEYSVGVKGAPMDQRVLGKVVDTGSWSDFKTFSLGKISLKAGQQVITAEAHKVPKGGVMNLREVLLTPAD